MVRNYHHCSTLQITVSCLWFVCVAVFYLRIYIELGIQPTLNHMLVPRHQQEGGNSPQDGGGAGTSSGPTDQNDTSTAGGGGVPATAAAAAAASGVA